MKYKTIIPIFAAIMLYYCTEENPVESSDDLFVVEAFLYEGEEVNSIHITETLPIGSSDTVAPGIDNAVVNLIKNGIAYSLLKTPDSSGYYQYEGTDLEVNTGDNFQIEVTYNGTTASGETNIPIKPIGLGVSPATLTVPAGLSMLDVLEGNIDPDDYLITISWNNPDSLYHYVVVQNLETNPETILDTSSSGGFRFGTGGRRLQTPPTKASEFALNPFRFNLTYMGRHIAIVYRVNKEYANLYEISQELDTRNLQEPLTNIENGLGVFTAFASDTVSFVVTR